MILMMLAGLYALIAGRIAVSRTLALKGRHARIYGVVLLVSAIPVSVALSVLVAAVLPAGVLANDTLALVINLAAVVAVVLGITVPFQRWQDRDLAAAAAQELP